MIIDSLSHVWESPDQLGRCTLPDRRRTSGAERLLRADPMEHFESLGPADVSLVLGFQSRLTGAHVPNKLVADYVRGHPDRLIGVAGIDPTDPGAAAELDRAAGEWGMKAVAVSPCAQGFHPMDTRATGLYERVCELRLPLIVDSGPCPAPQARLEYAQPVLLDEVVREFGGLTLVVGSMGYPFIDQTLALLRKHANVFGNLAGLLRRPWLAYNVLAQALQFDVLDRLLFASGFPYSTPAEGIETLYSINQIPQGTNLPTIPRELLRGIVERDTLAALGIEKPAATAAKAAT